MGHLRAKKPFIPPTRNTAGQSAHWSTVALLAACVAALIRSFLDSISHAREHHRRRPWGSAAPQFWQEVRAITATAPGLRFSGATGARWWVGEGLWALPPGHGGGAAHRQRQEGEAGEDFEDALGHGSAPSSWQVGHRSHTMPSTTSR